MRWSESTSVLEYLRPELALAVIDPAAEEVEAIAASVRMGRFHAVVTAGAARRWWAQLQELMREAEVCGPSAGVWERGTDRVCERSVGTKTKRAPRCRTRWWLKLCEVFSWRCW